MPLSTWTKYLRSPFRASFARSIGGGGDGDAAVARNKPRMTTQLLGIFSLRAHVRRLGCRPAMLLIVLISIAWALAVPPPPPSPIDRAEQALNGLFRYYQQVETKNRPIPKKTGCPCHHCNGEKCAIPDCVYCGTRSADPCPSKQTVGCYTTAKSACTCNLPPGPVPANATSPATYFFACGQMGGLAPSGATSEPMRCTCEVDWPSACTFCYRWWSAVALEAAANYAIAAELALNESLGATIMHTAESMWIHSPYNSEWVRN